MLYRTEYFCLKLLKSCSEVVSEMRDNGKEISLISIFSNQASKNVLSNTRCKCSHTLPPSLEFPKYSLKLLTFHRFLSLSVQIIVYLGVFIIKVDNCVFLLPLGESHANQKLELRF